VGTELLGLIAGIIIPCIGGIGWLQERSNKRTDAILDKSNERITVVLEHIQRVEAVVNDLRADFPLRYTLREDFLRLAEKVDQINEDLHHLKGDKKSE
jgi:hypothetical protein